MIILGADQGSEHCPGWSFAPNLEAILSQAYGADYDD
jgi:hypothetical protein